MRNVTEALVLAICTWLGIGLASYGVSSLLKQCNTDNACKNVGTEFVETMAIEHPLIIVSIVLLVLSLGASLLYFSLSCAYHVIAWIIGAHVTVSAFFAVLFAMTLSVLQHPTKLRVNSHNCTITCPKLKDNDSAAIVPYTWLMLGLIILAIIPIAKAALIIATKASSHEIQA